MVRVKRYDMRVSSILILVRRESSHTLITSNNSNNNRNDSRTRFDVLLSIASSRDRIIGNDRSEES